MKSDKTGKKPEKKPNGEKAFSQRFLNTVLLIVGVIISIAMLMLIFFTMRQYNLLMEATKTYDDSLNDAAMLRSGSDYLTEQVRLFVINADRKNLDLYFEELEKTRRRDSAVEDILKNPLEREPLDSLSRALNLSNELCLTEYRAMRLTAEATGQDLSSMPDKVREAVLSDGEKTMTSEDKRALASELVFGREYQEMKSRIMSNIDNCTNALQDFAKKSYDLSGRTLHALLISGAVLTAVLAVSFLLVVILTSVFIFRPLRMSAKLIGSDGYLKATGPKEMRNLAISFNEQKQLEEQDKEKLSYEALHDGLTGLENRNSLLDKIENPEWGDVAVIALDIDGFKTINDRNGHDAGDKALKCLADAMKSTFRSGDYLCRNGGDEFTVVMIGLMPDMKEVVKRKVECLAALLTRLPEDVEPFTISAGVAFGKWADAPERLLKNADNALYNVKFSGKMGISFYGENRQEIDIFRG